MAWLVPRSLPQDADRRLTRLIGDLAERLDDPGLDRNDTVREFLARLIHARPYEELADAQPWAAFALDPRHVIFEAERYRATDPERFARVKPLLWAWTQVDATPFGANFATGVPLRRMLAERVFARAGRDLRIFPHVEFSVGYNVEAGDGVTLHRHVFVDDIGGVELHDGASLSDFVNVYSHTHALEDSSDVTLRRTVIGRRARVAYHATVLAGTRLGEDSMLGAMALATRDVDPHVVALGVPARPHVYKGRMGDPRPPDAARAAPEGPDAGRADPPVGTGASEPR